MKSISIITNKKVDTTFNGVACLLKRTIVKTTKINDIKRFEILTQRCNYVTTDIETNVEVIDEVTNEVTNEVVITQETNLVSLSQKDTQSTKVILEVEANAIFNAIKDNVNFDNGYLAFENKVEQLGLLLGTQQDLPWGTLATDWELLND